MRKTLTALALAVSLLFAGPGVTPAHADTPGVAAMVGGRLTMLQRQQSCPTNQICFYGCPLSGTCGYWFTIPSTRTSCTNIYTKRVDIQSVRNQTGYNFKVWHNSTCTNSVGNTSVLYAHSSGNMNTEWRLDGIGSAQRLLS